MTLEQPNPAGQPPIRASDDERDAIVHRLAVAVSEGRLTLEEHIARVDSALEATTRVELAPLVADLPLPGAMPPPTPVAAPVHQKRRWIISVMGEHNRLGRWKLPGRTAVVTFMAETKLDLRGALIEEQEVHISAYLMMGEQRIIVPKGVDVEVTGFVFMGSRKVRVDDAPPRPGAPRVVIRAVGMMGEVRIETL